MDAKRLLVVVVATIVVIGSGGVAAEEDTDMIAAGEPFVDFDLPAHDGSTVHSGDLEGQSYLLFFYPKADTPG